MKTLIYVVSVMFFSNYSNAKSFDIEEINPQVVKVVKTKDICTITYTVRETSNGVTTTNEYTLTAETCEEVEASAIDAGIIKSKKITQ